MKRARSWWRAFDELFFPRAAHCPLCAERPGSALGPCQSCYNSLAIRWEKREVHGYPYYSLLPYQGYARDLIHKMKFQNGFAIARAFGGLLGLALSEELSIQRSGVLLPVPLHSSRLQRRGFNHAGIIADNISKVWKLPVSAGVVRVRQTVPQSGLSVAERRRNLLGAFRVLPGEKWRGKQCVIVDDVITSGYTFSMIANVVQRYGARPVGIFVARTETDGGGGGAEKL